MATKRFYLTNLVTSNSWACQLSESAQTAATTLSGWTVGTGSTFSQKLTPAIENSAAGFVDNVNPDGTPGTDSMMPGTGVTGQAGVSLNGDFAAGNWVFQFSVVSPTQGGAADGQIVFRVCKASTYNATPASPTEITSGQVSASVCTNVASSPDSNSTATVSLPAFTLTNEYLYIQVAWKRTGAGGMTTTNIFLRTGSSTTVGTSILTTDFTPAAQAVTNVFIASTAVLNAAWVSPDILVAGNISTASARGGRTVVFPTALIGYVFYCSSTGVFGYSKTTDGGLTWGAHTAVDGAGATTVVAFDIWFDGWTPGDNGTLIHTWWFDTTNNTVRWRTLNITGDVLGTVRTVFAGASAVAGRGAFVSGTKTRSGYLYCAYDIDAGTERGLHRSIDSGTTWSTNLSTTFVEATLDTCKLFPASGTGDDNDCWALYYDQSALALTLKLWDSSAVAQVESATIGVAHTDGPTDLTGQFGYDGVVRHTDGHLIVAALSGRDVAASQHQVFDCTSTSTITTKTAIAASTDDHYYPQVTINQGTGTIFVAYNGKRDGSEVLDTATKVYYTYSFDGGTTWNGGDVAYMDGAAVAVQQVWTIPSGSRLYFVWRVGTQLWGNFANSLVQLGATLPTIVSTLVVNVPTVALQNQPVTGVFLASTATLYAPTVSGGDTTGPDLITGLVDWWNLGEGASGNATGAHAGIVLTETGGTIGVGAITGRAARDFEVDNTQYLATANTPALQLGTDSAFLIAIRGVFESSGVGGMVLISKDANGFVGGADREFVLYQQPGGGFRFAVWDNAGSITQVSTAPAFDPVVNGTPYTVIAWHDPIANKLCIDVNGAVTELSYSGGTRIGVAPFQIGAGIGISNAHFDGLLGSCVYAKRVWTTAERTAYYNAGLGLSYNDAVNAGAAVDATDNFNRANGLMGPEWINHQAVSAGLFKIVSNKTHSPLGEATIYRSGVWADNQSSQAIFISGDASYNGVTCRASGPQSAFTHYLFISNCASYSALYKVIAGATTLLLGGTSGIAHPASGSAIRITAIDDCVTVWDDGVPIAVVRNSDVLVGAPGLYHSQSGGFSSFADDWAGKNIVGQPMTLTSLIEWWDCDELTGNLIGKFAGKTLTDAGGVGVGAVGGRAARNFPRTSTGYASRASESALQIGAGESFTIAFRCHFNSSGAPSFSNFGLVGRSDYTTVREWWVMVRTSDTYSLVFSTVKTTGFLGTIQVPSAGFTLDLPHTVICEFDQPNGIMRVTIDDDQAGAYTLTGLTGSVNPGNTPFKIGWTEDANAEKFSGGIGAVAYFRGLLSSGDKTRFHNGGYGISYEEASAVAGGGPTTPTILAPTIASTLVLYGMSVATVGTQFVTTPTFASSTILRTPKVLRAGDLTDLMVGHWPMNQSGAADPGYDVHGGNALTTVGSAQAGQNAIDGTPARDFEFTGTPPTSMAKAGTSINVTDTSWTFICRFKFESLGNGSVNYLFTKSLYFGGSAYVDADLRWQTGFGFRIMVNDGTVSGPYYATVNITPTFGTTYIIAGGFDMPRLKAWIRINNGTRVETDCPRSYDACDTFLIGAGLSPTGTPNRNNQYDGAAGPASFWYRPITDAEMDTWITAKGDYVTIGGVWPTVYPPLIASTATLYVPSVVAPGVGDQAVTTVHRASTTVLNVPTVRRFRDLTLNMVGHWPFSETGLDTADALDQRGTNPLTALGGTGAAAQDPMNGTPARYTELDNLMAFRHADNADLSNEQGAGAAFTFICRVKFETNPSTFTFHYLVAKDDATGANFDFYLYYQGNSGFRFRVCNAAGFPTTSTGGFQTAVTPGTTYFVAGVYNPAAGSSEVSCRWGTNPGDMQSISTGHNTGVRDIGTNFTVGGRTSGTGGVAESLDGAIGPATWFKRALSNAEIDHWVEVNGDYAAIGGGGDGQSVLVATIASTTVLRAPTVYPFRNLTPNMIGHWPMNEPGALDSALDVQGGHTLTTIGGAQGGQNPIDGIPARDFEFTGTPKTSMSVLGGTDFNLHPNTSWTAIVRCKFESNGNGAQALITKAPSAGGTFTWGLYWDTLYGFSTTVNQASQSAHTDPAHKTLTFGATYVVAGGYDATTGKVWIRINNEARIEATATGTHDVRNTLYFGLGTPSNAYNFDGAMGPASFWKYRSLSDAEIDHWITVNGNFVAIGGGTELAVFTPPCIASTAVVNIPYLWLATGTQPVTTPSAIVSTAVVYAAGVYPAQNLTPNLIGHWPMNETSGNALDAHGTNPLTLIGTAPSSAQDPIDGTGARALEGKANLNALTHGDNADLSFSNDQAFTWIVRVKFESTTPAGFDFLLAKGDSTLSAVTDFMLAWSGGIGFFASITDTTGAGPQIADPGPGNAYRDNVVFGKTYVVATGYDPVTDKVWIRVNNNPRVEFPWTTGTRDHAGATTLFLGFPEADMGFDGAMGPASFFKRSLSDAELDYWIGVRGNYALIGGGGTDQSVLAATIAATTVLRAPGVYPFQNLMLNMKGHWPMDESGATANAVDAYADNDLTMIGTGQGGQNPIDNTPARDFEFDTGNHLERASNPDLNANGEQPWTVITRVKFESITGLSAGLVMKLMANQNAVVAWGISWRPGDGFEAVVTGSGVGEIGIVKTDPAYRPIVPGTTYVVAGGYDPVAKQVWIRVNNDARISLSFAPTTYDIADTLMLGAIPSGVGTFQYQFDGAEGPTSFWKRVLTDAEIDYWIGIKGDFAKMGGGSDQSILAATIAPTTVLNQPTVANAGVTNLTLVFIGSTAVLNVQTITTGAVTVTGGTRAAAAVLNVPTVTVGPVTITNGTRVAAAQLNVPTIAVGPVTITGGTIPSALQAFVPSVAVGAVTVTAGTIASGNQRFVPTVAHFVSGATIASGNQRFAPTVALTLTTGTITTTVQTFAATVGLTVTTGTVPSFSVMYFPSVATGPVTIAGAFITSVVVAFAPSVTTGAVFISGVHVPTTMQAFAPSVAVGPVAVTTAHRASTVQLFTPTLTAIDAGSIGAATITTTAVANAPSVVGGLAIIGAQTIASTIVVRVPSVAVGPVTLLGVTLASTGQSFAPSLTVGPVTVTGATIAATTQLFAPSLTSAITTAFIGSAGQRFTPTVLTLSGVVGQTLASTLQMFAPTLTTGAVTVVGSTRVSALTLFEPSVGVGVTTISGGTRVAAAVLFPPSFVSTLDGTFIVSTAQLFAPTVRITQFVSGAVIPAGNALFVPSLLPTTPVSGGTRVSALLLFAPSVTTGPVTIIGSTVPATTLAFTPSLGAGAVTVALPHLASALVLSAPSVSVTLVTPPWATTTQLFAPSLTTGPVAVQAAPRTSTLQMYAPTLGAGVTTSTIVSTAVTHAPTLIPLVTTPLWAVSTVVFAPGVSTLGEMFAQHIPSGTLVFPPQMVAYAAPPEILDFESNIVTAIGGTVNLCSSVDGTVILTRGVAMSVEVERVVDMSPSVVRRDFEVGVER